MHSFFTSFNNREIALFVWAIIFIIGALFFIKGMPLSLARLLKTAFSGKLLLIHITTALYVSLIVYLLAYIGLWDKSLLKDSIVWFFGAAMVLVFNTNKSSEHGYFKKVLNHNFRLAIILEFILNFYSFNLTIELFLIPFAIFFGLMREFSKIDPKYAQVKNIFDVIFSLLGLSIVIYSIFQVMNHFHEFAATEHLKELMLPPLLTILFIPYNYILALYFKYEVMFALMSLSFKENIAAFKKAKRHILFACKFNLAKLNQMDNAISRIDVTNKSKFDRTINRIKNK